MILHKIVCYDNITKHNIIKKYCSKNINMFDCFSEEYNCDYKSDIYCLLEQILNKTTINISNKKIIFNMKIICKKDEYLNLFY